ncbi:MAG: threonine ammonia-lyase [Alphaproteobacteria bacterium]|nr:threonine ammonia-lyase [Alphaproteobacteria bacterium SS10]
MDDNLVPFTPAIQNAPTVHDIEAAASRIQGQIERTPTVDLHRLGEALGCTIMAKLENLQHTASFKERGALNCLSLLTPDQQRAGVVAMSAGNHAQGVAYHAGRLGVNATIVMPKHTPFTKVERTQSLGAKVELHGETLQEAREFAENLAAQQGLIFVHPYDDPSVIAGQGTVALEMLAALDEPLDTLIVPIGGGGLMSGIATAMRARSPETELIGVQSEAYPAMRQSLRGEEIKTADGTLAEGIAVKEPGQLTRQIIGQMVDDIVLVSDERIEQAIYDLSGYSKIVAEGAGAAGIAAIMDDPERFAGMRVGVVICGGNIDDRLFANLLLRGMVSEQKIIQLRITLPDRPGALAAIATVIADAGGNIVEVQHQRMFNVASIKSTTIDIVMETRDKDHANSIVAALQGAGFPVEQQYSKAMKTAE